MTRPRWGGISGRPSSKTLIRYANRATGVSGGYRLRLLRDDRGFVFRFTRSGSFFPPVSRFHSSNVCAEILPSTRSCANFRRCAWLLNGIASSLSAPMPAATIRALGARRF